MGFIDLVAPFKSGPIKQNSEEWLNGEYTKNRCP